MKKRLLMFFLIVFLMMGVLVDGKAVVAESGNGIDAKNNAVQPVPSEMNAPEIQWKTNIGGSGSNSEPIIEKTEDGGYIVVRGSFNVSKKNYDYWITKLNSGGAISWNKTYGGSKNDMAYDIQQTIDDGYIVAGYTESNDGNVSGNHGKRDYWVVKLNNKGEITWSKSYGGSRDDEARSIQQTSDGGYIVAGFTQSSNGDVDVINKNNDYWILKLDTIGNISWKRLLSGNGHDRAYDIKETRDGGFIIAGEAGSSVENEKRGHHGGPDYWIIKLDSSGKTDWDKFYGGSSTEVARSIEQTSDGGYIVAGYTIYSEDGDVSGNHGKYDFWVVKLDGNGGIDWKKNLGGSDVEYAYDVHQTSDGGYIVAGSTFSNNNDVSGNHGNYDYWVVKLDKKGGFSWSKTLGGSGEDKAFSIQQTLDEGFIVAGVASSDDGDVHGSHGNHDTWIVKLKPELTVSISATDATASESGKDPGTFTVSRAFGNTNEDLTVNYHLSGTATNGKDYKKLSGTVTIPAGSTTAKITVTPSDDLYEEKNETVIATLIKNNAYNIGSSNNAIVTIKDDDKPQVSIKSTDSIASEPGTNVGKFTVTRTYGMTAKSLTVKYTLNGTAVNGKDYTNLTGTVTIPAGATTTTITVKPINDKYVEKNETVIVELAANNAYKIGSSKSSTVTIQDEDKTEVSIKAADSKASESGSNTGTFTVTRNYGSTNSAMTVYYNISGTAANGKDYTKLGGKVTIPAGSKSATIKVKPLNDKTAEKNETVIATLSTNSAYVIGSAKKASITIYDNDKPEVGIKTADSIASEPGSNTGKLTVTRVNDSTGEALTVYYTVSGTAANGKDYKKLSGKVTIPAGSKTASITVTPLNDKAKEKKESVIVTLKANASYKIGTSKTASVTISDND